MADNRPESSYLRVKNHLYAIAEQIRSTDLPLEKALDLYEEAIRLGNSCADLIDMTDFSLEEIEAFTNESAAEDALEAQSDDIEASEPAEASPDAAESHSE